MCQFLGHTVHSLCYSSDAVIGAAFQLQMPVQPHRVVHSTLIVGSVCSTQYLRTHEEPVVKHHSVLYHIASLIRRLICSSIEGEVQAIEETNQAVASSSAQVVQSLSDIEAIMMMPQRTAGCSGECGWLRPELRRSPGE